MQGNYPYQSRIGGNSNTQGASGSSSAGHGYDMPSSFGSGWTGDSSSFPGESMARGSYGNDDVFAGQSSFGSTQGNQGSYSQESFLTSGSGGDYGRGYESSASTSSPSQAMMGTSANRTLKRASTGPDGSTFPVKREKHGSFKFNTSAGTSGEFSGGGQSWGSGMPSFGSGARGGQHSPGGRGVQGNQAEMMEDLSGCTLEQLYLALKLVKTGVVGTPPLAGATPGQGAFMGRGGGGRGRGNWSNQAGFFQQGNWAFGSGFQNQGRGRGRGQNFNMAGGRGGKSQQAPVDNRKLSREERLKRLCQHLKETDSKLNSDIQTLENALTATHVDLHTDFRWEELLRHNSKVYFTGTLSLSNAFLARSVGGNKKEVKRELYQQAVKCLKTMSVPELLKIKDQGFNAAKKKLEESLGVTEKDETVTHSSSKTSKQPSTERPAAATGSAPSGSLQNQIEALSTFLKNSTAKFENRICELISALKGAKCNLQQEVDFDEVRKGGLTYFLCTLKFNGVPMGHGSGNSKKLAKAKAFEKTYQALISKSSSEIVAGAPEDFDLPKGTSGSTLQGKDSTAATKPQQSTPMEIAVPEGASATLTKFIQLRNKLGPLEPQLKDLVNAIDTATGQLSIVPMCIFSKPSKEYKSHCDLYLDELLIASGDGSNRRESKLKAYSEAWEMLKNTAAEDLVGNSRRLKPEDKTAPGVVDVCVKGQSSLQDSNLRQLQEIGVTEEDLAQPLSNLIFMEHAEWVLDRRRHAYSILSKSATWCKMLLSWTIEPYHSFYKCEMELQHQPVGQAYARSKNEARSLAAADAIFKMYRTHPVIKVAPNKDDSLHWVEIEEVRKKVAELREAAAADPSLEPAEDPGDLREEHVSPYFTKVIENYITEFKQKNSLDELIFGTGMQVSERREIQQLSKRHGLRNHNRHHQHMNYIVMYAQRNPREIMEALKQDAAACWKYCLEDRDQLPQHQEIEHLLLTQAQADLLTSAEASKQ